MRRATCARCGGPGVIPRSVAGRDANLQLIREMVLLCHGCIHRGIAETRAADARLGGATSVLVLEELWALPEVAEPAFTCPVCRRSLVSLMHYINCDNGGKKT